MKPTQEQFLLALARIETFSPAPRVLSRAMVLLRDPLSDIGSIAALVGSDPTLATDIIRCSNSAYYRVGEPVRSIGEAVQKIGMRETIRMLNVTVARTMSGRDLRAYGMSGDAFWAESLLHGLFLFALADTTDKADADEAYTVGLLRFMGRLAIDRLMQEHGEPRPASLSFSAWEESHVGFIQAHAGALLLSKWQFSENIIQAVANQDRPERLPKPIWLASAMRFASQVLPSGGALSEAQPELADLAHADGGFMMENGLTLDAVGTLLATTRKTFSQVRAVF
jgi:HD-like signal output (HDOD) protein